MSRKLNDEDARIVDMLFDSGSFTTDTSVPQIFSHSPEMFNNRFAQVEKILKLLDEMPASDPPANLIARTFDRIDKARERHPGAPPSGADADQRPST